MKTHRHHIISCCALGLGFASIMPAHAENRPNNNRPNNNRT